MNSEMFSILEKALDRAEKQDKMPRKPCHTSISDEKILANLWRSSEYENYVKDNLIDEVAILMNNNKDFMYGEVAKLSTLSVDELRRLWKEKFRTDAPQNAKKTMLLDRLTYHFRKQAFGGLSAKAQERLDLLEERLKKGESLLGRREDLVPGMIFSREYNGEKHTVKVLDGGKIEYRGEVYRSLSAVASKIAGCRWNGYKFFHVDRKES